MVKITVLDDYPRVVSRLHAVRELEGLPVALGILTAHIADEAALVAALHDTDCLVLIRERTRITGSIIDALPG